VTATAKHDPGSSAKPSKPVRVSTPWGTAALVEELRLPQQVGDRRFASLVQLLELPKGDRLVRFAYATDGVARRGPVTLRERDLTRLRELLERQPHLKETLGF
jgi:hypothetical protein